MRPKCFCCEKVYVSPSVRGNTLFLIPCSCQYRDKCKSKLHCIDHCSCNKKLLKNMKDRGLKRTKMVGLRKKNEKS